MVKMIGDSYSYLASTKAGVNCIFIDYNHYSRQLYDVATAVIVQFSNLHNTLKKTF